VSSADRLSITDGLRQVERCFVTMPLSYHQNIVDKYAQQSGDAGCKVLSVHGGGLGIVPHSSRQACRALDKRCTPQPY